MTTDTYLIATKDMSDEGAYQVVKALWEYNVEPEGIARFRKFNIAGIKSLS